MNKKFSINIISKIKEEKIKQTPKYFFVVKNILVWFFLILTVFLGSLSLSISFDYLINADWYLFQKIGFIKVFLVFIPIFWILFVVISSILVFFNYRNTKKGYKSTFLKIILINFIISIIFSVLFYIFGIGSFVEKKLEENIPKYRSLLVDNKEIRMLKVWQNEYKGLLIGEIIEKGENEIVFLDSNNKKWNIDISNKINLDIKHKVNLDTGEKIKIIGEKINENNFIAKEIRPYLGGKKRY